MIKFNTRFIDPNSHCFLNHKIEPKNGLLSIGISTLFSAQYFKEKLNEGSIYSAAISLPLKIHLPEAYRNKFRSEFLLQSR